MVRRRGGWACIVALVAIGCRAGTPTETARGAVTAAVQIGAETSVDQPAYEDRQGTQLGGWAIPGGPGALIVWEDSGDYSSITGGAEESIYGARVDAQGALLDRVGFSITPMPQDNSAYPMGAYSVDRWLVIWYDLSTQQIRGARVGSDGTLLDPTGIDISGTTNSGYPMAVVPDADGFVVMWTSNVLANNPFYMAKVGFDGTVTPAGGGAVTLPSETPPLYVAAAAAVGNQIALLMVSGIYINPVPKALLVDHTGAAVSALSAAGGPPYASNAGVSTGIANAAASNGNEIFVLWQQYATLDNFTPPNTTALVARRLGTDGQWIDAAPIQVRAAAGNVGRVGVLWDGTNFICYWVDHAGGPYRAQLYYLRYAPDGTPVDAAPVAVSNLASVPYGDVQLTLVGGQVFATLLRTTTTNEGDQSDGILLRVLDATLKPLGSDATIISTAANGQYSPRAAGAPGGAFVVWVDDRRRSTPTIFGSPIDDIYGALVTPGSAGLAQTVTPVLTSANTDSDPAVAWDGTRFTIVFRSGNGGNPSGRYVVHVNATGALTGAMVGPLETTDYSAQSLLTWNGSEYLIAWFDGGNTALGAPYEGRRLSSADALLDATHFIVQPTATNAYVQSDLGGVGLGGTFLLTSQAHNEEGGDSDVFGLAVGSDGVPATTTGVTLANGAGDQDGPAIATDGTSALVLWRDNGAASGPRLLARHVDAALATLDASDVVVASATPPDALGPPALAWTGSSYVAVWTTVTAGLISFAGCTLGANRQCVAGTETSVSTGVSAGPSAATVVEVGVGWPGGIQDLSLVWTGTGGVLFYRRFDDDPLVRRLRLYARSVSGTGAAANDGGVAPDASSAGGTGGTGGTSGSAGSGGTVGGGGRGGGGAGGSAGVSGASGTPTGGGAGTAAGATGNGGRAGAGGGGGTATTGAGGGAAGGAGGNRNGAAGSESAGTSGQPGTTGGSTGAGSSGCSCELPGSSPPVTSLVTLLLPIGLLRRRQRRH